MVEQRPQQRIETSLFIHDHPDTRAYSRHLVARLLRSRRKIIAVWQKCHSERGEESIPLPI